MIEEYDKVPGRRELFEASFAIINEPHVARKREEARLGCELRV